MENKNILASKRVKQLRQNLELTQKEFAKKLEVKNNIADIERCRTKIPGILITQLMNTYNINPLWIYGFSTNKYLNNSPNVSPKVITLNTERKENIVLVDAKAAAGYPSNIQNLHWYKELPEFNIPLPQFKNATFRCFQVQGDSMLPHIKPNEWIIAKAINDINSLSNKRICIIILTDSVLIKQVNKLKNLEKIQLISFNKAYPIIEIKTEEVLEIWEVSSKLSFDIETTEEHTSIEELKLVIENLNNQLKKIKL